MCLSGSAEEQEPAPRPFRVRIALGMGARCEGRAARRHQSTSCRRRRLLPLLGRRPAEACAACWAASLKRKTSLFSGQVLFRGPDMHFGYVFTKEALAGDEGVEVRSCCSSMPPCSEGRARLARFTLAPAAAAAAQVEQCQRSELPLRLPAADVAVPLMSRLDAQVRCCCRAGQGVAARVAAGRVGRSPSAASPVTGSPRAWAHPCPAAAAGSRPAEAHHPVWGGSRGRRHPHSACLLLLCMRSRSRCCGADAVASTPPRPPSAYPAAHGPSLYPAQASELGVWVSNIPSAGTGNAIGCAEHAMYLMMATLRDHNAMADRCCCWWAAGEMLAGGAGDRQ